ERPARLVLLIAAARVDQDGLAADLEQPAMHHQPDAAALRFVVMRRQPVLVLGELRVRHFCEDLAQRIARDVGFLDAHDGGFTDFEHCCSSYSGTGGRPRRRTTAGSITSARTRW